MVPKMFEPLKFDDIGTLAYTSKNRISLPRSDKIRPKTVFVCVEVLRPSQPNRVMSSAVSLPNHTFTVQA